MSKEKSDQMVLVVLWQSSFEPYVCDLCCWLQNNCDSV